MDFVKKMQSSCPRLEWCGRIGKFTLGPVGSRNILDQDGNKLPLLGVYVTGSPTSKKKGKCNELEKVSIE
jgi:hypothetical protein